MGGLCRRGQGLPKSCHSAARLYRGQLRLWNEKIRQVGTGTPLTSSILPVTNKFGFTDQVGSQESCAVSGSAWRKASARNGSSKKLLKASGLATSNDNFYASSGAISVPAHRGAAAISATKSIWFANYEFNKGLNFGVGYARLFAGQFLKTTTPGHDYSYPYAYVEYNFSKSGFHFPITPNKPISNAPGKVRRMRSSCYCCQRADMTVHSVERLLVAPCQRGNALRTQATAYTRDKSVTRAWTNWSSRCHLSSM